MHLRISTSYNICHIFSEPKEAQEQILEETTTDPSLLRSDVHYPVLLFSMLFNMVVGGLMLQLGLLEPLGLLLPSLLALSRETGVWQEVQVLLENLELPVEELPVQEMLI